MNTKHICCWLSLGFSVRDYEKTQPTFWPTQYHLFFTPNIMFLFKLTPQVRGLTSQVHISALGG